LRRQAVPGQPDPATQELLHALGSLGDFFNPWPGPDTRERIRTWQDGGKYALCWAYSRVAFLELLAGLSQNWRMFSPSVATETYAPRARLVFADGSTRDVRSRCEPEDITR